MQVCVKGKPIWERLLMSERGEAKRIGAKLHKNSGRGMKKADMSWNDYIVDSKEYSKSFSLSQDVWAKIVTDTLKVDKSKSPALLIVLGETHKTRLAIIEWSEFERLVDNDNDS
jgi:hypothetical protein